MTNKKTVLIVDDAITNIRVLNGILEHDYQICASTSGEECLQVLETADIHLLLLDANMPGLDGYAVLRSLRMSTRSCTVPVIMITGDNSASHELRALQAGADEFIAKPVNPDLLKLKICRVLNRVAQEHELARLRRQPVAS
ncbi:MAG TPA: response regulator [Limnobacter sp.]|nr:response regulator [Limnobacter sp.]